MTLRKFQSEIWVASIDKGYEVLTRQMGKKSDCKRELNTVIEENKTDTYSASFVKRQHYQSLRESVQKRNVSGAGGDKTELKPYNAQPQLGRR